MVECYIYLVCLSGSWVNFYELFVDPVDIKFDELYSHVRKKQKNIKSVV
jgi:hypothetical protein